MIGAVIGDIIGSTYEWHNVKSENFKLFHRDGHFTASEVIKVQRSYGILKKNIADSSNG